MMPVCELHYCDCNACIEANGKSDPEKARDHTSSLTITRATASTKQTCNRGDGARINGILLIRLPSRQPIAST